jgi:glycosyltransferase involved in cell wall biosynthesis
MLPLVSVIIPCFNAERWIAEAIDSCLQQTYKNIEIIVVDDGSTDNSLAIIQSYGNKIIWQCLPHKGGNYARNAGFALSTGKYIQYLDADDYILPEKIEMQVNFLEANEDIDVVYGDWRCQHHLPNNTNYLGKIEISGVQVDILESLLADWWVALAALLYKRTVVEKTGGWDETLKAAQDRDFFLSVAMNHAKVAYQSGCHSIYRRYGETTVSTLSKTRWIDSHYLVMDKIERKLSSLNQLSAKYRYALARCYFSIAREALLHGDNTRYLKLLNKTLTLSPEFKLNSKRLAFNIVQYLWGFRQAEKIAFHIAHIKMFLRLDRRSLEPLKTQIQLLNPKLIRQQDKYSHNLNAHKHLSLAEKDKYLLGSLIQAVPTSYVKLNQKINVDKLK